MFQAANRWKYLKKKLKLQQTSRKQTGGARKTFEFEDEMTNALDDRADIFPRYLAGSSVKGVVKKRQPKSLTKSKNQTASQADVSAPVQDKSTPDAAAVVTVPSHASRNDLLSQLVTNVGVLTQTVVSEGKQRMDLMQSMVELAKSNSNRASRSANTN